jgi:DNA-binding beta-propeller fold protein YncE
VFRNARPLADRFSFPVCLSQKTVAGGCVSRTARTRSVRHSDGLVRMAAGCAAGAIMIGSATASTYTAYVPVCCNSPSAVSVISTEGHRISGAFNAGAGSYAVALPTPGTAWVTNEANRTISVVNVRSGVTQKTITLGLQPWQIKASPDGSRVYVVTGSFSGSLNHYSSTLIAFDAKSYARVGSVALTNDGLMNPGLAVAPDGKTVYATFDSQSIGVYDTATATLTATWGTTRALTWTATGTLTLSPDGATLYTAGQVITAFDTATGQVRGTVAPPGPPRSYSFVGTAITSDGSTLYATFAAQIGNGGFLASIDAASLTVTSFASLGTEPQQPVLSADGSTLYVPDAFDSVVYVTGTADLTASATIALAGPIATATLSANGKTLYVPNQSTASVLAVDPGSFGVITSIAVGSQPTPPSATADGSIVYVGGVAANSVARIDTTTNAVSRVYANTAANPSVTGANAPQVLVTPNGRQLFLGTNPNQTLPAITVIETATGAISGVACPAECSIEDMVTSPDSSRLYASGFRPFGDGGGLPIFYVIDASSLKVIANSKTAKIGPMAASPSGTFLYIVASSGVQVFDTTQNAVTSTLPLSGVRAIAFSPDGATAYAATASSVELIDTSNGLVTGSIAFPGSIVPSAVTVSPDGSQVWVTPANSSSLIVVTPASGTAQSVNLGATVSGVAFGF